MTIPNCHSLQRVAARLKPKIDRLLAEHPALQDVAVIGVPDERRGEVPKAVVVLKPGATLADPNELVAWCRDQLAHYKCPKTVDVLAELPHKPTGKILKRAPRQPYWYGSDR